MGVHDNFFALGGHSLRGLQLIDRVNQQSGSDLKIIDLFRLPTVAQLAELLVKPSQRPNQSEFVDLVRPTGERGTVAWIGGHMSGLLNFLDPSIGIMQLKLDGMQTDKFHRFDVDAMADLYAAELLRLHSRGPLVVAGFSYSGLLAYALTLRLRDALDERVVAVLLEPSVPRRLAQLDLLSRMRGYRRKLYYGGLPTLYRSVWYRWKRYFPAAASSLAADMDGRLSNDEQSLNQQIRRKWDSCFAHYRRNIAEYRAPHTSHQDIHVIAGAWWLSGYLETFERELAESPNIHNLGDTEHLQLPEDRSRAAIWTKRIDQILSD